MKGVRKSIVIVSVSVILACFLVISSIHVARAGEPVPGVEVYVEQDPDEGIACLQNGSLNIWSEPLTSDQMSKLAGNPSVTLVSHLDLGMCELDMNNQKWPTGDPKSEFYKLSSILANQSLEFRQAIACLVDRDLLVNSPKYFGGYGYRMDVPIPPSQSAYADVIYYTGLKTFTDGQSIIYDYNITRAEHLLDLAGFTMIPPKSGHDDKQDLRQDPTTPGEALRPITFVISQDDPKLLRFGQALAGRLRNIGIQVNTVIGPRSVCLKEVVSGDFNLYIGHWSFDVAPTQYYDLYSSDNYYGPSNGLSPNYVGFCNNGTLFGPGHVDAEGFDYWAWNLKYAADTNSAAIYARTAGIVFLMFCPVVPLLCQQVFQAYSTSLKGVVNNAAYGIDNGLTFSIMSDPAGTVIKYGILSDPAPISLNIITCGRAETEVSSLTGTAPKILSMMYDSLMTTNPWTLEPECWLAQSYSVGSWNATSKGGDPDATLVNFTIRPDIYWHNNTSIGRNLDVYDIIFTFNFMKACSQETGKLPHDMARSILQSLKAFDHCTVDKTTNNTCVYFLQKSAWALQWAGELPIVNRDIWGLLWNNIDPNWPEELRSYNPAIMDLNGNGLPDLSEDGTGLYRFGNWTYDGRMPTVVCCVDMNHYGINQEGIKEAQVGTMFHGAGDVNIDGDINVQDLCLMARAMFTNSSMTHGTGWGQYNPGCDLNSDRIINANDLSLAATNYGKTFNG